MRHVFRGLKNVGHGGRRTSHVCVVAERLWDVLRRISVAEVWEAVGHAPFFIGSTNFALLGNFRHAGGASRPLFL